MRFFLVLCFFASMPLIAATEVRFCYEDKHAPPFIHGAGQVVPAENPGVTIEIVKQLDAQLSPIRINYVRKPWSRCLHELEQGKVDAVVASYRQSRDKHMAYPKRADGKIDNRYAINKIGVCLLQSIANDTKITLQDAVELAVPRGYAIKESMPANFSVFETDSLENAITLVENDLLDATIGLCQIGNMPITLSPPFNRLKPVFPPLETTFGFMAFSKQFYQLYPDASWLLWRESQRIDLDKMYQLYLDAQSEDSDKQ